MTASRATTPELKSLGGTQCPGCPALKGSGRSFCLSCYYSLPVPMRQALYRSFGEGYEEAIASAIDWLKAKQREQQQYKVAAGGAS